MNGEAYVRQLKELSSALSRLNEQSKKLREKQKDTKLRLAQWMEKNGHQEYQGHKLAKIKPKPKIPKKPPKERKHDALLLFGEIGIPDPSDFWDRLQDTQKYNTEEDPDAER